MIPPPRWQWITWIVRCSDGQIVHIEETIIWNIEDVFFARPEWIERSTIVDKIWR